MAPDIQRGPIPAATMSAKSTTESLFEFYNAYSRRPTVEERRARSTIFKALGRVLRGWLPSDPSTPIQDSACGEGTLRVFLRELGYTNLADRDISPENAAISLCGGGSRQAGQHPVPAFAQPVSRGTVSA